MASLMYFERCGKGLPCAGCWGGGRCAWRGWCRLPTRVAQRAIRDLVQGREPHLFGLVLFELLGQGEGLAHLFDTALIDQLGKGGGVHAPGPSAAARKT